MANLEKVRLEANRKNAQNRQNADRKLGVESLETRLSMAAGAPLSSIAQYYLTWYQAKIKGTTTPTTPTVPTTGPIDNSTATGPKSLAASSSTSAAKINLSWTAATATTGTITVERSTDNSNFASIATVAINTTSYSDSSVDEGTTYYYRLRVTGSALVNTQASATTTTLNASGVAAAAQSNGDVNVTWSDKSAINTGYYVERSTNGTDFTRIATVAGNASSYTDTNSNYSTTYFYRVTEITAGGTLTPTLAAQVTTVAAPAPVPQPTPTPTPPVTPPTVDPNLKVVLDGNGLSKISYAGVTLLDVNNGIGKAGGIASYGVYDSSGDPIHVNIGQIVSTSWDASTNTLTQNYSNFKLTTKFTVVGSALNISSTVTNTGSSAVAGVVVTPFILQFPKVPAGFNGNPVVDVTTSGVVAETADYGSGMVTIVGMDTTQSEIVGWNGPGGQNASSPVYAVRYGSVGYDGESNWKVFGNTLTAGQSTTMTVELRFSPEGTDMTNIAKDVEQRFGTTNPFQLTWSDKRTIATVYPAASEASKRTATNPNGWLNDPTIDVTTTAGLDKFYTEMLAWADKVVATLKANDAQGAILWDMEGEANPKITYIGDPRMIDTFAPELEYKGLIDKFIKKFTDAGLKIGMTIRAQQLQLVNGVWQQTTPANVTQMLEDKIQYAKNRWGATLFYIDSNEASDEQSIAAVQAKFPDSLLIPENVSPALYAYSAPYRELRTGREGTTDQVRQAYPNAFSAISLNDSSQAQRDAAEQDLVANLKAGDIALIHWWDTAYALSLYQEAGLE